MYFHPFFKKNKFQSQIDFKCSFVVSFNKYTYMNMKQNERITVSSRRKKCR